MKPLRVRQAADLLGVHRNTLYKALRSKGLRAIRISEKGNYLIPVEELRRWAKRTSS